jgi:hypothetical protein
MGTSTKPGEVSQTMATLNEKQAALFTDRNWGVIATIREDGSPQATPSGSTTTARTCS